MKLALAGAALFAGLATAAAQDQAAAMQPAEIGPAMSAYVDGDVELRQFWVACAQDPADWDHGAAILTASLDAAGLDTATTRDFSARLAASGTGAAKYDCTGAVAAARIEISR